MSYDEKHLMEGISRKKYGNVFVYYYIDSKQEVNSKDLERIKMLKIPPAWTDVWIAQDADSMIQVIGKDARGRKQYKYHQVHIDKATQEKFVRLYSFIKSIPKLEKTMLEDNSLPFYTKNKILSLMLQMVKDYQMRVGKEIYAKTNKSYGISSLRKRHVKIQSNVIYLKFKGKSNQRLSYTINNEYYIKCIKMLMKLEGDKLFQYITIDNFGNEQVKSVTDKDLNEYIQKNMGQEFTIKDFRTYGANLYFIKALLSETKKRTPKNRKTIKKNLMNAFKTTAKQLKHTGTVSKKSYVMNFAIELYQNSPEYFVKNKNADPHDIVLDLLKLYKKNIMDDI